MAVDPSIIMGLRPAQIRQDDPLGRAVKVMGLQSAVGQNRLQGMQMRQIEQAQADEEAMRGAYREAGGDAARLRQILQGQGNYKALQGLEKSDLERRKTEAGIGKDEAAANKSNYDRAIDEIQRRASMLSVANPQNWGQVRRMIAMQSPDAAAQMPEQFDPTWVQTSIAQGQTITQRLADQRARETQQITMRGQDMTADTARRGQDITVRGQNMTDSRAREGLERGRWSNDLTRGIQINMDTGETRPIVSGGQQIGAVPTPLTESQGRGQMFGSRAAAADKILRDLEGNYSTVMLAGKRATESVPVVGGALGALSNVVLSESAQKAEQAQRDFINAVLRQESGAVISEPEFENARKQYFPQPGDSQAVIMQKEANRKNAIEGFKNMAGSAASRITSEEGVRKNQGVTQVLPGLDMNAIDAEIARRRGGR